MGEAERRPLYRIDDIRKEIDAGREKMLRLSRELAVGEVEDYELLAADGAPARSSARFDGREEGVEPKNDDIRFLGWHCYMNPSTAAQGILKLHSLPAVNPDLPNDDYPDLSKMSVFKRMARNGD